MLFRLLFVLSVIIWSVNATSLMELTSLMVLTLILLLSAQQGALFIQRSVFLLLWLIFPILLLHSFFTPGTYISLGFYFPITNEGLMQGFLLCMHMLLMYFSAALLLKIISKHEWLFMLSFWPKADSYFKPKLLLLQRLQVITMNRVNEYVLHWKKTNNYRMLPETITQLLVVTIGDAKQQAFSLWQDWELNQANPTQKNEGVALMNLKDSWYLLMCVMGWGLLWKL